MPMIRTQIKIRERSPGRLNPERKNIIAYEPRKGLTGRVPKHVANLNSALDPAMPPARGEKGYYHYKRMITDLIGNLHFHLSNID